MKEQSPFSLSHFLMSIYVLSMATFVLQLSWVLWQTQLANYPECLLSGYFLKNSPTPILGYSDQETPCGSWRTFLLGIEFKFGYYLLLALPIFFSVFNYVFLFLYLIIFMPWLSISKIIIETCWPILSRHFHSLDSISFCHRIIYLLCILIFASSIYSSVGLLTGSSLGFLFENNFHFCSWRIILLGVEFRFGCYFLSVPGLYTSFILQLPLFLLWIHL